MSTDTATPTATEAAPPTPPAGALVWSEALRLHHPEIDTVHEEFVAMMASTQQTVTADPEAGLDAWRALVAHTEAHFAMEDRWMDALLDDGAPVPPCHRGQHAGVLELMHEVTRLAEQHRDFGPLQRVIPELAQWFDAHARSHDATLVELLKAQAQGQAAQAARAAADTATPPVNG